MMDRVRLLDLDSRRRDYEFLCLTLGLNAAVCGGFCIFVYVEIFRIARWRPGFDPLLFMTIGCVLATPVAAAFYVRSLLGGRYLDLDLVTRSYELRTGLAGRYVLYEGSFQEFRELVLESRIRRVYGDRYVKHRTFLILQLRWKSDEPPFCFREFVGDPHPPQKVVWRFGRKDPVRLREAACEELQSWGERLALPTRDLSDVPAKGDLA